jgi:fatty acid desaturase
MGVLGLRHNADLRTLGFMGIYFATVTLEWMYYPESKLARFCLFWLTTWFAFIGATTVHNSIHCPLWPVSPKLGHQWKNSLFQVCLSLWYGHAAAAYVPGHNLSHHRHLQTRKDIMRTSQMQYENNFFNLLMFAPTIFVKTNANDSAYFNAQRKQGRPIYRQLRAEMCAYVGLQIVFAYHNPWKWLVIFWIPHLLGKYGIITMNMLQHDGCDENHRFNHSRNFTDPFLNFATSNNGYHTIHHMYPGKHWSRLKDEHEKRIKPHMHPALDEPSIWGYIIKAFIYPGIRKNYDGGKFRHCEMGDDEPWFYGTADMNGVADSIQGDSKGYAKRSRNFFAKDADGEEKAQEGIGKASNDFAEDNSYLDEGYMQGSGAVDATDAKKRE